MTQDNCDRLQFFWTNTEKNGCFAAISRLNFRFEDRYKPNQASGLRNCQSSAESERDRKLVVTCSICATVSPSTDNNRTSPDLWAWSSQQLGWFTHKQSAEFKAQERETHTKWAFFLFFQRENAGRRKKTLVICCCLFWAVRSCGVWRTRIFHSNLNITQGFSKS